MNIHKYPSSEIWENLAKRPVLEKAELRAIISEVFQNVKENGDEALKFYTEKFDRASLDNLSVSEVEIAEAVQNLDVDLKQAIETAKHNIESFHQSQFEVPNKIETTKGVVCWRESRAIERVGIYVPGGTAPLFSTVLMLAIPAKLAGCKEIILCTPPNKNGKVNPAVLFTAHLCGVTQIYKVGGAQAIAGMTLGTETIPKVYKLFGPGNQFVTGAKQMASEYGVAIDMPAGPSEVLVLADQQAIPEFCASDLLSQAEHGSDSQVVFVATDEKIFDETLAEVTKQLEQLPRMEVAKKAIDNSHFILLKSVEESLNFSNLYAPEHLILAVDDAEQYIPNITNAGSVFLGNYSCESAGDYASGTNHTLPTDAYARNYSGVSLDSFIKKITFQKLTKEGIQNLGSTIELMAEAEGLYAHKNAVSVRLKNIENEEF